MADQNAPIGYHEQIFSSDVANAPVPAIENSQQTIRDMQTAEARKDRLPIDSIADAFKLETTYQAYQYMNSPAAPQPDPSYTPKEFDKQFEEASKLVPGEVIARSIGKVTSAQDFQQQFDRIKESYDRQERLKQDGWGGTASQLLAGILDPASLAIGIASGGLSKGAQALKLGVSAGAVNTVVGAGAGLAMVGAKHSVAAIPPELHEYIIAASAGGVLQGIFGPIAKNPALRNEAARLVKVADDIKVAAATPELLAAEQAVTLSFTPLRKNVASIATKAANDAEALRGIKPKTPDIPSPAANDGNVVGPALNDFQKIGSHVEAPMGSNDNAVGSVLKTDAAVPSNRQFSLTEQMIEGMRGKLANAPQEAHDVLDQIKGVGTQIERALTPSNDLAPMVSKEATPTIPATYEEAKLAAKVHAENDVSPPVVTGPDSSAGAKAIGQIEEGFLKHEFLSQLSPDDVARTAMGSVRMDLAGVLGRSKNYLTRVMGDLMLNDTVGKVGHAVNGQAADVYRLQLQARFGARWRTAFNEAKAEWAKANNIGLSEMNLWGRGREFNEEVGMAITQRVRGETPGGYSPQALKAAKVHDDIMGEIAELMQNPLKERGGVGRSLPGAEELKARAGYMHRMFNGAKMNDMIDRFGIDGMYSLVAHAIRSVNTDLDEALIQRLSKGYLDSVHGRNNGVGDPLASAFSKNDRAALASILRTEHKMGEDEITNIISRMMPKASQGERSTNLKSRQLLDENAKMELFDKSTGKTEVVRFHDMLVHDADDIMSSYLQRNMGRIALAGTTFKDPSTGKVIINGITSDQEFAQMLSHVREAGADVTRNAGSGYSRAHLDREIDNLQWAYDRMMGRPMAEQQGGFAQAARIVRNSNLHLLSNIMFSQMAETGAIVQSTGLRAFFQQAGGLSRIVNKNMGRAELRQLHAELNAAGIGVEGLHNMRFSNGLDIARVAEIEQMGGSAKLAKLERGQGALNEAIMKVSLMPRITDIQQTVAAAAMSQRIFNMAQRAAANGGKFSQSHLNRMAQLGIAPDMLEKIGAQLVAKSASTRGVWGSKLGRLNLDSWTDLEARAVFEQAIFRSSRKMIQTGDIGMQSRWMSGPMAQLMLQFKNFSIMGWANHSLYAAHNLDFDTFAGVMFSTIVGGTAYATQQHLSTLGRPDRDKILDKNLQWGNLGRQAFQRVGASSVIPMLVDATVTPSLGGNPLFGSRASGAGASRSLISPPFMGQIDNLTTGINGIRSKFSQGRDMSQQEIRALTSIVPMGGFWALQGLLSPMIKDAPSRTPKKVDLF